MCCVATGFCAGCWAAGLRDSRGPFDEGAGAIGRHPRRQRGCHLRRVSADWSSLAAVKAVERAAATPERATQRYPMNEYVPRPSDTAPIVFASRLLYVSMAVIAEHQTRQHIGAPGHQRFRATSSRAVSGGRQRATGQRRPTLRRLPGILRRRGRPSTRPPRRTRHVQVLDVPMTRPFPRSISHRSRRSGGRHH